MSVWQKEFDLARLNQARENTLMRHLGIEFTEFGDDYISATMPVDQRTHQPMGLLHGGASVVLAETLGSTAATLACPEGFACVGLEINANHMRAVRSGLVTGITKPLHIGRSTQVWEIKMFDQEQKMNCISRITLSVIKHRA
ncbi:thioesterase ['Osedax' symbiont bacterium Rs2_46_30_T18]|nr:thioesterase ['Osedax' symbiont bacterium Rs2_46_30_T18]